MRDVIVQILFAVVTVVIYIGCANLLQVDGDWKGYFFTAPIAIMGGWIGFYFYKFVKKEARQG